MCVTCGCSSSDDVIVVEVAGMDDSHGHAHDHGHDHVGHDHVHPHVHDHDHEHGSHIHAHHHLHPHRQVHAHALQDGYSQEQGQAARSTTLAIEQAVLAKNQLAAERNRGWFAGRGILALNLMSSPGAGKTTLLERTIQDCQSRLPISVIEGDQATVNDTRRILATGCKAIQINTGTGCHLDAEMLARGLEMLKPPADSVLMIENVGNLVCPALFDLGERAKVVILSVTEGDDKPLKYPHMFHAADVLLLNKIDLLAHVRFDVERCMDNARSINPRLRIFQVSATSGQGLADWYEWLAQQRQSTRSPEEAA